jgi:hypothetical protein
LQTIQNSHRTKPYQISSQFSRAGRYLPCGWRIVIPPKILLTRIEDWEPVATVHAEFFGSIRPANTIMQVVRFIDPDWLVEVEADAVVES